VDGGEGLVLKSEFLVGEIGTRMLRMRLILVGELRLGTCEAKRWGRRDTFLGYGFLKR
jgi:hypothetical protein